MSINRTAIKNYAPKARQDFIAAAIARAAKFGISEIDIVPMQEQGDVVIIDGEAFPKKVGAQRKTLAARIKLRGFYQTIEEVAYTWFNRFLAIRYMEVHGYLDHGYRVLSHPDGGDLPEILEHAEHLDLAGLDTGLVEDLKLDGSKDAELYRLLLIAQCNALNGSMPFLFEKIDDETELLLPDNLLHSDSLIRQLVNDIDEADWQEIEIIGWLYQFYISEKKDQVIGKVVKSEDIPAATQLFTPNWMLRSSAASVAKRSISTSVVTIPAVWAKAGGTVVAAKMARARAQRHPNFLMRSVFMAPNLTAIDRRHN